MSYCYTFSATTLMPEMNNEAIDALLSQRQVEANKNCWTGLSLMVELSISSAGISLANSLSH